MSRTDNLMLDISVCLDEIHDLEAQLAAAYEGLSDLECELAELDEEEINDG